MVAAVLAVFVVVLGIVLLTRGQSERGRKSQVLDASQRFAVALSSYDYRHLDADFAEVRAMSTEGFQEEYDNLLGGPQFVTALKQSKAVSKATVKDGPFLARLAKDEGRTFTVVEQRITNATSPKPRVVRTRVELYLVHLVSGWRIDRVDIQ